MHTIEFDIITNVKDNPSYPSALEVCGVAFAEHISQRLMDIRDPKTGEPPRLVAERVAEGMKLSLRGSDWCIAEAQIRIHAMLAPSARRAGQTG